MRYDTAVVLSHFVDPMGQLTKQSQDRVDAGVRLLDCGDSSTLTLSGGKVQFGEGIHYAHAERMKAYVLGKGADPRCVYTEEQSLDTVGQAILTRRDVVEPNSWERFVVVSNDYHIPRVQKIFRFVFPHDFLLHFVGVSTRADDGYGPRTPEREAASTTAFEQTFRGVQPGCLPELIDCLLTRHPLYADNPLFVD